MFGVAGNFIKYSDRRLKQDVEKKMPSAVSKDPRGYRRVDYRKALHLGV